MYNIVKDLSVITTVPEYTLYKLNSKECWCIGHCVNECKEQGLDIAEIDIGIGTLLIKLDENIKYKFVPSNELKDCIKDTIDNKKSPLLCAAEQALSNRLKDTYKDYFK